MSVRPWINYHHLYYFRTIASEGGIAKAAKKLRLGQPTLSTQMKQFETVLGQQLFDRSKRSLQLSEAGKLILGYANEIFKLGDEMIESLNDRHATTKVQVHIGAMDTVPKHLVLKVFKLARQNFDCTVAITEGHGDELMRELRAHRISLVVSNYPPSVGEAAGFYTRMIARMPVVICGSAKYAKLRQKFPTSLNDQPFIMPSQISRLRHDVEHYLKLAGVYVHTIAEVQDTSLQKLMGQHGDGLIPIALPAAEELIANKDLIVIGTLPDVYEELWFIAGQRRIENPVALAIMKNFKL